jgi:hypothetical protein
MIIIWYRLVKFFGRLSKVIVNQFSDGVTQSVYFGLLNIQIEVARQVLRILLPQLDHAFERDEVSPKRTVSLLSLIK